MALVFSSFGLEVCFQSHAPYLSLIALKVKVARFFFLFNAIIKFTDIGWKPWLKLFNLLLIAFVITIYNQPDSILVINISSAHIVLGPMYTLQFTMNDVVWFNKRIYLRMLNIAIPCLSVPFHNNFLHLCESVFYPEKKIQMKTSKLQLRQKPVEKYITVDKLHFRFLLPLALSPSLYFLFRVYFSSFFLFSCLVPNLVIKSIFRKL